MKKDADGKEVWWISSPKYGVRLAWFIPMLSIDNPWGVMIMGETPDRTGIRDWKMVQEVEGWIKVAQVDIPDGNDIALADYVNRPEVPVDEFPTLPEGPMTVAQYQSAMFMMMGMFLGVMDRLDKLATDNPASGMTVLPTAEWKELKELAGAMRGVYLLSKRDRTYG